jgi:type I restriction enzyme S subunit
LFISIAGTVGKPCITSIKACIHDGFVYFPKLKLNPQFFFRIFEAEICYGGLGKFGTQLNLNTDTIGSIKVAVPPPEELTKLLTFIDKETTQLDTLTQEAQTAIALLQERRTALISAAVTGKMDVRKAVAA